MEPEDETGLQARLLHAVIIAQHNKQVFRMSEEPWHGALLWLEDLHTRFEMAECAIPYASSVHLVVYVPRAGPKIT